MRGRARCTLRHAKVTRGRDRSQIVPNSCPKRRCQNRTKKQATHMVTCRFMWWALQDLNLWPLPCQGSALPLRCRHGVPTCGYARPSVPKLARKCWCRASLPNFCPKSCTVMSLRVLWFAFADAPMARLFVLALDLAVAPSARPSLPRRLRGRNRVLTPQVSELLLSYL